MKLLHLSTLALGLSLTLTGCSKLGSLSADNFTVTPNPLEAVGGKVTATIDGRFPEKYMKKKAVVSVIPVLRYDGGEAVGQRATFQGEKVLGNDQTISYRVGGNYTMKTTFDYVPAMRESQLYLTFDAVQGKKHVTLPEVKVADGVLATATLLARTIATASTEIAPDAYQHVIAEKQQAQIKYLIQQSKVRSSELTTTSVTDFVRTLRDIKADQRSFQLDGIEVSAYASPDGNIGLNTQLAEAREQSASKYVKDQLHKVGLEADLDSRYTAEDWEGFQSLVSASNIQDKEVILRVLSMYKDPEEREQQIRHLSAGFTDLADEILPELRRSRMTIHYNIIGRSDSEIQQQYAADASRLSVEELLYAATLTDDDAARADIYTTATRLYPADYRAYNNLGCLAYARGDKAAAKAWLDRAEQIQQGTTEVSTNRAILALADGQVAEAEGYLASATTARAYNEVLGQLLIAEGRYPQAATAMAGVSSNSAALAHILAKDYASASRVLDGLSAPDATTDYLRAIVAARTAKESKALEYLRAAVARDASLKTLAANDLEFVTLFADSDFQQIVK